MMPCASPEHLLCSPSSFCLSPDNVRTVGHSTVMGTGNYARNQHHTTERPKGDNNTALLAPPLAWRAPRTPSSTLGMRATSHGCARPLGRFNQLDAEEFPRGMFVDSVEGSGISERKPSATGLPNNKNCTCRGPTIDLEVL